MTVLAGRLAAWPMALRLGVLLLAGMLVFLPGQTTLPPTDRDEARFVQASRQMLETGDFIDIRFQDEARHKKPVGIYWLQSLSAAAAGGSDAPVAAFRVPSLLGAALAAALTAWAVAPLVGAPAAVGAAVVLGTTVLLHVEARIAKTDAMLLAVVVLAMGALARLWLVERAGAAMAMLFWGAVGMGILLKGPIILLPVVSAMAWVAVAERRLPQRVALRPGLGLIIVALIAGPWLVAITLQSGLGFWSASVGEDMLAKVASGQEGHGAVPGYFLALFPVTFWPWSVLVPFAGVWLWQRRRERAAVFLMGWIVPTWLVFELVPTKLPHYVLPTWPAIAAVLSGALLDRAAWSRPAGWLRGVVVGVWALPAMVLVGGAVLGAAVIEQDITTGAALGAALAGAAGVPLWMAGRALWQWQLDRFAAIAAPAALVLYGAIFHLVLPSLQTGFLSPRLAETAQAWRCGADGPIALTTYTEPSAVFALGTDTLLTDGAEAGRALASGRAALAFVGDDQIAALASAIGSRASALTRVEGFNYSRGRWVQLTLFAFDRESGAPCDP